MMRWALILLLLALLPSVHAATISGTVYDFSLGKVPSAIVEVNSTPVQKTVTTDGAYEFSIPEGDYEVKASVVEEGITTATGEERISVTREGTFKLDIILFPQLLEDVEPTQVPAVNDSLFVKNEDPYRFLYRGLIVLLVLFVLWAGNRWVKRQVERVPDIKTDLPDDLQEVLAIVRRQGGRIAQRELRKHLSHSEAKVSLMVEDLSARGLLRKIKKGRGNILIIPERGGRPGRPPRTP